MNVDDTTLALAALGVLVLFAGGVALVKQLTPAP